MSSHKFLGCLNVPFNLYHFFVSGILWNQLLMMDGWKKGTKFIMCLAGNGGNVNGLYSIRKTKLQGVFLLWYLIVKNKLLGIVYLKRSWGP